MSLRSATVRAPDTAAVAGRHARRRPPVAARLPTTCCWQTPPARRSCAAHRPGPSSARSAARRPLPTRPDTWPAPESRVTCRPPSARPPGNPAPAARSSSPRPATAGSCRNPSTVRNTSSRRAGAFAVVSHGVIVRRLSLRGHGQLSAVSATYPNRQSGSSAKWILFTCSQCKAGSSGLPRKARVRPTPRITSDPFQSRWLTRSIISESGVT